MPAESSHAITQNHNFFEEQVAEWKSDIAVVCKGLTKLFLVDIALDRNQDNPQLIFESMNSTGLKLSNADLIRNFILMGLDHKEQSDLYEQYWRPLEILFGQKGDKNLSDKFMRHYLTVKSETGKIPRINEVYKEFKKHASKSRDDKVGIKKLVKDIHTYAVYYGNMALDNEDDPTLRMAFDDLRELNSEVAFPFLLELYRDYDVEKLNKDDLLASVRLVETYIFRRAVCGIPTNSHNKTFASFKNQLDKGHYLEGIKAHLLQLTHGVRFPQDEEFQRAIQEHDLYNNFSAKKYWLRRLENYGRKEQVKIGEYTIEHIMPQGKKLSAEWKEELGSVDWLRIHETYLHTLGNLTLTGYNSEYGNRSFLEKRDMTGGFRDSPLKVNKGLGKVERWNEDAIKERAEKLAKLATKHVWPAPVLPKDVLAEYSRNTRQR